MVDLIVPSGTVLQIDSSFNIEPKYEHFRMEANATIRCDVDLVLHADRAEFAEGCLIDARGKAGAPGTDAPQQPPPASIDGTPGVAGGPGSPGAAGHKVTIEAGLAKVGGLTIAAGGGPGGSGGAGQPGSLPAGSHPPGLGGSGGPGGHGGDGGLISLTWTRLAPGLPTTADTPPPGHTYISPGGLGGSGGVGGPSSANFLGQGGQPGVHGTNGAPGAAVPAQVRWIAGMAGLFWVQKQDMGPAPRALHDVGFDPGRGRVVLFGGAASGETVFGDTWEWDGQFWIQVADTGPSARSGHALAYDFGASRILLFGGRQADGALLGDTWAWDGRDWIQLADKGPAPREGLAMAGDPARGRVVLFGGGLPSGDAPLSPAGDTWEWEQGEWIQLQDVGPSARSGAKLAYDPSGAITLLFGGVIDPGTWAWDGASWKQVADMGPSGRRGHALSTADGGVILFGGATLDVPQGQQPMPRNDTWAWLEHSWRQIQDIGPAPRQDHAMAYDPAGKIVAFGGQTADATYHGDTWELAQHV